jgi:chloramphenicol-sensitive protein RarD
VDESRKGYLLGLGAYVSWGFFPLYFKLLRPAGPIEILTHRVIWSSLVIALLLSVARSWRRIAALRHRPGTLGAIAVAATLLAINWGTYVYGVNSDRVVETSLGYFITPLISVAFGLVVFGERLRPAQWGALGVGTVAVAVLTVDYGRLPWIALVLAGSFASYGLVKKRLGLPPTDGLFVESATLAVPALGYLTWLTLAGRSTFTTISVAHTALLASTGIVTAVPLLMFAASANRSTMTGLGILQYVAPVLQFLVGVGIEHEPMPAARLLGFALVWLALVVFTWDGLRRRPTRGAEPSQRATQGAEPSQRATQGAEPSSARAVEPGTAPENAAGAAQATL